MGQTSVSLHHHPRLGRPDGKLADERVESDVLAALVGRHAWAPFASHPLPSPKKRRSTTPTPEEGENLGGGDSRRFAIQRDVRVSWEMKKPRPNDNGRRVHLSTLFGRPPSLLLVRWESVQKKGGARGEKSLTQFFFPSGGNWEKKTNKNRVVCWLRLLPLR